jgi:ribosomal protein S18 acetylase RimI-like enzyme
MAHENRSNRAIRLAVAASSEDIRLARRLFEEYALSLGFSLCFQSFDKELADLPGDYAPPRGRLLLAYESERLAGCVALRPLEGDTCEMKRLYVRPEFRGLGLGRALAEAVIEAARAAGYRRMRLDTIGETMQDAVRLYRLLGFREIPPYRPNPIEGALYMELALGA